MNSQMETFVVNYDLKGQRDYQELYTAIKSYGTWAHILESAWAVVSEKTCEEVFNHLRDHIDNDDGLIVIKSGNVGYWRNVSCRDSWLETNL